MATDYISAISSANLLNANLINTTNDFSNIDKSLFPVVLQSKMNDMISNLWDSRQDSSTSNDMFSSLDSFMTNPLGTGLSSSSSSDLFSSISGISSNQKHFQLISQSGVIGKTVTAINPSTQKQISGTATSVQIENNALTITIKTAQGDMKIPPEYLLSVEQ